MLLRPLTVRDRQTDQLLILPYTCMCRVIIHNLLHHRAHFIRKSVVCMYVTLDIKLCFHAYKALGGINMQSNLVFIVRVCIQLEVSRPLYGSILF